MGALKHGRLPIFATLCALASVALSATAADPVRSQWKSGDIRIDGRLDEWAALTTVEDGLGVSATNDSEFLFVAISTNHPALRAGLAHGLVVWLSPANKQATDFGLQWPGTVATESGPNGRPLDPASLEDIDILGPGRARRLVALTPALGLQAASGTVGDTLSFELKVPLGSSAAQPHAVGAAAGRAIQLGLQTPEPPRTVREPMPAVPRTYGPGPIIGGPDVLVPVPSSSRRERVERPRTLKTWTAVQLAAPPR